MSLFLINAFMLRAVVTRS